MRMTLRELSAHDADDLLVALSLYRPGPLKGGLKDAFVRRHLGQEGAEYLHPALEPILRETYGVILYQEQVLRIAHEVAGMPLGRADTLRRAISKFRSAKEMDRLKADFVAGAQATAGLTQTTAQKVWDLMAAFAGYGFPKAHAAGYGAVAYRMAYLKTHYPAEFMAARLAVWGGYYRPDVYMSEARRLGLSVRPPHVNHSNGSFTLQRPGTLWMGLGQVRDLTNATIERIIAHRPYVSLLDLYTRAQPQHGETINLAKAGALEGLGNPKMILKQLEQEHWHGRHSTQLPLLAPAIPIEPEPTMEERAAWEHEVLGQSVSVHPVDLNAAELGLKDLCASDELARHVGEQVSAAGIRVAAHRFTANGERSLLVDVEDGRGIYQVLWSGADLERNRFVLSVHEPMLIRGRVRKDRQEMAILAGSEAKLMRG
jgi:DNA polymerase III alpha subunit